LKGGGWLHRTEKRLRAIPASKRALVILVVGVLLLGGLIALDQLWLRKALNDSFGPLSDVPFYRNRTQAVLDGKVLYRDVKMESPPLIVYLLLPPQMAGGSELAYQIYFSLFTILTALTLYWGLRRYDDFRAFVVSLLFLGSPFGTVESTIGIQDESIIVFMFIVAAVLAIQAKGRLSSVVSAIGVWTKIFPGLFYPVLFLRTRSWKERKWQIGAIVLISLLISLPFLILAPVEFLKFPLYYLLGSGDGGESVNPTGGISVWDFLRTGGLDVPGMVLLPLTIIAYVGALWYGRKKGMDIWPATLLVLVAFVIFYPRIWLGYFVLPVTFLLLWASEDWRISLRCFLMYLPFLATLAFTGDNVHYVPVIDFPGSWVVGLAFTVLGLYMLVDTARLVLGRPSFIDVRKGG